MVWVSIKFTKFKSFGMNFDKLEFLNPNNLNEAGKSSKSESDSVILLRHHLPAIL